MLKPLKIVSFGDVHMCHSNTLAEKIALEIEECFPFNEWASSIDILVLEGDFWDKLMPNNHPDVYITERSIYYLLKWCKYHDVLLLIVDGTPLHDAGQLLKFIHINKEANIGADVILEESINIRYIPQFDINVLFVPDRPRSSPEETLAVFDKLLKEKELDKVDFAIMHGCFQYQMPAISPDHKHVEKEYLDRVKGPIFIGHIHTPSTYERIIASGSFSRLQHGEEEPKGFTECVLDTDYTFKAKFIENKSATIYKTISIVNLDLEESLDKIEKEISQLPTNSRVRIYCQEKHPIAVDKHFTLLKSKYLDIRFTLKVEKDKSVIATQEEVFSKDTQYTPLIINKDNIKHLILKRISQEEDYLRDLSITLLEDLITG